MSPTKYTTSKKDPSEFDDGWKKGYDLGVKMTLKDNDAAIQIGNAILSVLDNRYEFCERDY
jgi:hypothetical protein